MKNLVGIPAIFLVALLTLGCSNNPLGMSDSEWDQLSSGERLQARKEQNRLDMAKQEARAERRRQHAINSLKEAEEQERLAATRGQASYGNVIQCNISNAKARFNKKWNPALSTGFEIQRGEKNVDFALVNANRNAQKTYAQASFDGITVKVCSDLGNHYCDTLSGSEQEYRRGKSKSINIKKTLQGTMRCSLPRRW